MIDKIASTATLYENRARFLAFHHLPVAVNGGIEAPDWLATDGVITRHERCLLA